MKKSGKFDYDRKIKGRPGIKGQKWKLFAVEVEKDGVKIDKREHNGFKWLKFEGALKTLTWKNQRMCLRLVDKFLKKNLLISR